MQTLFDMLPKVTSEAKKNISTALAPRSVTAKLNPVKLAELLSSKYNEELIQALGMLIGVFLQNRDMEVYMSRVINLLPRDDFELKRLCQILITEVAAQPKQCTKYGDVLLLSISPLYKDIVNFKTGNKLYALKSLPLLKVSETAPLLMASLKQIVVDKNPLVRRVAATTLMKLWDLLGGELDEEEYVDSLEFLLRDTPQVRCAAVTALMHFNRDSNLGWMHARFQVLVKDLPLLHHLDMERMIRYLHRYALQYLTFCTPQLSRKFVGVRVKDTEDLVMLLESTQRLVVLPYPSVIVAIALLHLDFPCEERLRVLVRTLIRFLNISSESKYVVLQVLEVYAHRYPELVKEHYRAFTVNQIEKLYCKTKKLDIVGLLVDDSNCNSILEELLHHTRSNQVELVAATVRVLGFLAQKDKKNIKRTVRALVDVLRSGSGQSKNHVVESFCSIMNHLPSPHLLPLLTLSLQYLDDVQDIRFKCAVVRLLNRERALIPTIATENLRKLALNFTSLHESVKYEVLTLGFNLSGLAGDMYAYLLTLAQFDQSLLLRDLARTLVNSTPQYLDNEALIHQYMKGSQATIAPTQRYGGLLSDMGYKESAKESYTVSSESTQALRNPVVVAVIAAPPQQPQYKAPTVYQAPVAEDPRKQKKELEQEVKKHYSNLDNVLNDFFVDD